MSHEDTIKTFLATLIGKKIDDLFGIKGSLRNIQNDFNLSFEQVYDYSETALKTRNIKASNFDELCLFLVYSEPDRIVTQTFIGEKTA
jgi:hypothetical protein